MKPLVIISAFLLVCALPTQAQQQSSLLWEISGKDFKQPSYVFGTFHAMCKTDFDFHDSIKAKLSRTSLLVEELDMTDASMQVKMMQSLASSKPMASYFPAAQFEQMNKQFQEITGVPLTMLNNFKPFMSMSMLLLKSLPCAEQVQPEMLLIQYAKTKNIPVKGLEQVEEQLAAIDKQPLDSQAVALQKMVMRFDSVQQAFTQLTEVYKKKHIDSLYHFMRGSGMDDAFETALLSERNLRWIPRIKAIATQQPSFFAVGAGHLGGDQGVIALLRKEGYTVKPVVY
ncbi:MAG: TraB/GumN family protein [Chitinophagales bacterium]|jgi:uncharacterized protein YbaP (TraB family)|nr:TraB/GumN family protein [Chitinophagales bacterium]